MRILHLISQKPSFTGSGTFYGALINESIKHNISPFLCYAISATDQNNVYFNCPQNTLLVEFENSEVEFPIPGMSDVMPYRSSIFKSLSSQQFHLYYLVWKKAIKKAINNFNPHVIWSHHLWVVSAIAKEISNIPVIGFCHGSDLLQANKCKVVFEDIRSNLEKLDVVIQTSPLQSEEISKLIKTQRTLYIGNGIRNDIFYLQENLYKKDDFIKLVFAGKLSKEKGVHCLITAVKLLINDGIRIKLNLFGGGTADEVNYMNTLIKGYEDEIQIKGVTTQENLSDYFNNSDILVLPSFYEGLGLVVLEAISCGCRAITTDLPNLISIMPREAFKMNAISTVSLPNIHGSLELNGLSNFCNELKENIKIQIKFHPNSKNRKAIANLVKEFTYERMFEKLVSISSKLINNISIE